MEIVEDKKQQIIRAAIRRFSHFGIFKTSMSEIGEDVALSKANLYYYFPDKWTLIEAIVDVFQKEADEEIELILQKFEGTEERLMGLIDFQFEYFSKYRLLFQNIHEFHSAEPRIRLIADKLFVRECATINRILKDGVATGEVAVRSDLDRISELYVTILKGLAHICVYTGPNLTMGIADSEMISELIETRKEAAKLILNGVLENNKQTI